MKTLTVYIILIACLVGCHKLMDYEFSQMDKPGTQPAAPANVEYFKPEQILLPDMVCPDTLIVKDAAGLNKAMGLIEQGFIDPTDDQIDSLFHQYCIIK